MTPELWAILIGLGVLIVTRVLDFFLPRGYRWKGLKKYAEPHEESEAADKDDEES